MFSTVKCTVNFNVLCPKICVPKEAKDIYVKVLHNTISNGIIKHGITKHANVNPKIIVMQRRWYLECTCICENSRYLKSIADTSVAACDEIIIVMN